MTAFAQILAHTGSLKTIQERVRFARARFGRYDLADFIAVLIGSILSGFTPQPDGTLRCPANHPRSLQERRSERDGSLMKAAQVTYPGTFHIGFAQESEQRVNEIYQHLKDDGFDVNPPQRSHAWTFYVRAPGGFTIEIAAWRIDRLSPPLDGWSGSARPEEEKATKISS